MPELSRLVEEITALPIGYFKPVVGRGAFSYEQWGASAALAADGVRASAFPYEPEVAGRSPRLVVGKWSDLAAVAQKLSEFGLTASAEQFERILWRSQMAEVAHHRPLTDDEFIAIALEQGAGPGE